MKARTVLINPRWSFKAHSGINNMSAMEQWTSSEINGIWPKLKEKIDKDATIFMMVSPTQMALGGHLTACKDWGKFSPRTVHSWHCTNARGSGRSLYDDSEYYCVVLRTPSRYYKKENQRIDSRYKELNPVGSSDLNKDELKELETSSWKAPMRGFGASYGQEVYDHIEKIGYAPYLQVFGRKNTPNVIPEHWHYYSPDKKDLK